MAKEVLYIPEHLLDDVIDIIRAGLATKSTVKNKETWFFLYTWCDEEEKYLKRMREEE